MADLAIDEALGNGIRPSQDMPRDPHYVREMLNQIPLGPRRARTLPQVTYPLASPSLSMSWPYPQILRDDLLVKYFGDISIYDVAADFTATQRTTYSMMQNVVNRRFVDTSGWTTGAGWAISSGVATATVSSADLTQPNASLAIPFAGSADYLVTYTVTRSAGSVQPFIGTQAGTSRSTSGTFTETITASGSNVDFKFTGTGFTGTIDNVSVIRALTITGTVGWQMVAFRDRAWFACTPTNFLYSIPSNPLDATGLPCVASGRPYLNMNSVCKHNGSLVFAGMSGDQLSNASLLAAFAYWRKNQKQEQTTYLSETLDDTYIAWANYSGGDFNIPFFAFLAMFGIPGSYEATMLRRVVVADLRAGRMGFYRPRFCGTIRRVMQLGQHLIVYGKNGVSRLTRTEAGYSEDVLLDQGIPVSTCVAGDDREHIFPTTSGEFYSLTPDSLPRLLGSTQDNPHGGGFRELVANMTEAAIVGTFDPLKRRFWFSDGTKCYCWTGYGMGESDAVQPSSLFRLSNSTALYGTSITKSDPQVARIVSTIIDNGGDTFEISSLDFTSTEADSTSWTATTDYRMRTQDAFKRPASLTDVPDRGRCYVKRTGVEQRVVAQAPNYKEVSLDRIGVTVNQGAPALANIFAGGETTLSETYP